MPNRKKPKGVNSREDHSLKELIAESRRLREQALKTTTKLRELAATIAATATGNFARPKKGK